MAEMTIDQQRALALASARQRASQASQPASDESPGLGGTLVDMARSVPGGLAKGVSSLVGLPGDVRDLLDSGANAALSYTTGSPVNVSSRTPISSPTSKSVLDTVASPFGGVYQPKTIPGQYAETVSSFAPAALVPFGGGAGGIGSRIARAVVPGVASEIAGQFTKARNGRLHWISSRAPRMRLIKPPIRPVWLSSPHPSSSSRPILELI